MYKRQIVISAVVITVGTLALYLAFRDEDPEVALTMAFTVFVFFQLVNSFCVRSGDETVFSRHSLSNRSLLAALVGVVLLVFGTLFSTGWQKTAESRALAAEMAVMHVSGPMTSASGALLNDTQSSGLTLYRDA